MDIKTAPIDLVYREMVSYWSDLSKLFSKSDPRGPPRIATINVEDPIETPDLIRETLQFYPDKPSEKETIWILTSFCMHRLSHYNPHWHVIFINRAEDYKISSLAEEVTHSVVSVPEGNVEVPYESFRDFNGYAPNFGNIISEALDTCLSSPQETWLVNLSEFFPPLGHAHLLQEVLDTDWVKVFRELISEYSDEDCEGAVEFKGPLAKLNPINNLIEHLPRIVGELMVKLYEGDIEALLREHPQLPHLDGPQLWAQYCKPLLSYGKL